MFGYRFKLRGIHHIVFYELPRYPHFYSEICNMLQDNRKQTDKENLTCSVIYSSFDAQRLADIVGTDRAARMISSSKKVHMFVTGENSWNRWIGTSSWSWRMENYSKLKPIFIFESKVGVFPLFKGISVTCFALWKLQGRLEVQYSWVLKGLVNGHMK